MAENRDRRVTMKDIAAKAGVSHMTVSRALSQRGSVAPATAKRIRQIADELGYERDPVLSALAAYRQQNRITDYRSNIAWLTPKTNKYGTGMVEQDLRRVQKAASRLGYTVEHFVFPDSEEDQGKLGLQLYHRGIRGIIINSGGRDPANFNLGWQRFASICLNFNSLSPFFISIIFNHYHAVVETMRILKERGYRRPGLCASARTLEHTEFQTTNAYRHSVDQEAKFYPAPTLLFKKAWVQKDFQRWVRKHDLDVVLCDHSDYLVNELETMGFRIPEDIGFASLDLGRPPADAAGMTHNYDHLHEIAIDLLNSQLMRNATGLLTPCYSIQLESTWREGKTLRPPV